MDTNNKIDNNMKPSTEIVKMRNHFTYIFEQMWGIIVLIAALLFSSDDSFRLALELFSQGNIVEGLIALGSTTIILIIICIWCINRWYKTTITVSEGTVTIERRTLNRYVNAIAVQNISNINLEQNLFEILMGTYKLKLDTNSLSTANATDVKIVLKKKDAYAVKNLIMAMMKEIAQSTDEMVQSKGVTMAGAEEIQNNADVSLDIDMMEDMGEDFYDVTYSIKEIVVNCLVDTSISLILFSVIFFISSIVTAVATMGRGESIVVSIGGLMVQILLAGSMITALVKAWMNDFRFRAKRYKDKIYVSCGLIKRRKYAVPVDKINAICFQATFLGRLSKRAFVKVINVGGEDEDVDGMKILLAGTQEELRQRLAILLPEYVFPEQQQMQRQPGRVLVKELINFAVFLGIFSVSAYIGICVGMHDKLPSFFGWLWWVATIGLYVFFVILSLLAYQVNRLAVTQEYLMISRGMFAKTVVSIPYRKIQYICYSQGPMDRVLQVQRANVSILASMMSQNQGTGTFPVENYEMLNERLRETY